MQWKRKLPMIARLTGLIAKMHFAENTVNEPLFIRSYHNHLIKTLLAEFSSPIVLFHNEAREGLLPQSFDALTVTHFQTLSDLSPELILLGTGEIHLFPAPSLLQPLFKKRIGIETMTTDAACRTFNLLLAEERAVLAALFV